MGLGKTIQAITFLHSLWREGFLTGAALVVAPLSTLVNWEREFEVWAPDMYLVNYSGYSADRRVLKAREFSYQVSLFSPLPLVLVYVHVSSPFLVSCDKNKSPLTPYISCSLL